VLAFSCNIFCVNSLTLYIASSELLTVGKANLMKYKDYMSAFNVVEAGGWHTATKLAADPKTSLLSLLTKKAVEGQVDEGQINAIVNMLQTKGKGFSSDIVDGDWLLAYSKNSQKSPLLQKILGRRARKSSAPEAQSNFITSEMKFSNISKTPRRNGEITATVKVSTTQEITFLLIITNLICNAILCASCFSNDKYTPVGKGFTISHDGSIVVRRIMCDIVNAGFKYRSLPRLPLPIRASGGYLDFLYLDDDIRITRGNRGGLFIHVRPNILESMKKLI